VRDLSREILEEAGYTVLGARHGAEALVIADRHPGPIHLLLTDVVMPGLGGPQLADRHRITTKSRLDIHHAAVGDSVRSDQRELHTHRCFVDRPAVQD